MRHLRALLLLVPALLALVAGGAGAGAAAPQRGLDPTFGVGGVATVEAGEEVHGVGVQVGADGRIYVLAGSLLLAFESSGAPAAGFGLGGRVTVASAAGEGTPADLALDSQGRLLVVGSARPLGHESPFEAYVIRFLPDGSRDPSFGTGGEIDTDFGLPNKAGEALNVSAVSIAVDAQDRPIVGGAFGTGATCSYSSVAGVDPYLARLSATGAPDPTFGGTGYTVLREGGEVGRVSELGGGKLGVFTRACSTPPRFETRSPGYSVLTEGGAATKIARQVPLAFSYLTPLIDPAGRVVQLESVPPAAEGVDAVARYRPNGEPDPGFGRHGKSLLRHKPHFGTAIAVDAESRPVIALGVKQRIVLRRYLLDGKVDRRFGPNAHLAADGTAPVAIALDGEGRIYTFSLSKGAGATTLQIDRFIAGP